MFRQQYNVPSCRIVTVTFSCPSPDSGIIISIISSLYLDLYCFSTHSLVFSFFWFGFFFLVELGSRVWSDHDSLAPSSGVDSVHHWINRPTWCKKRCLLTVLWRQSTYCSYTAGGSLIWSMLSVEPTGLNVCDLCGFKGKPVRILCFSLVYKTKNVGQTKARVSGAKCPDGGGGVERSTKAARLICMNNTASCSAEYELFY